MEYSGVRLPGIFCPDESIEQFARLYGSDNFSKMMIMATTSPPRTVQATTHSPPGMMEGNPCRFYGNAKTAHNRNLKVNHRYTTNNVQAPSYPQPGIQHRYLKGSPRFATNASQGSGAMHRGCGDHYCRSANLQNFKPEYPVRPDKSGTHNPSEMHCNTQVYQHLNYYYPPPPGPRFPWL
ncbi:uncharacterized protein LOC26535415 isoform X2 [Drosophila yakuba]|uniref:Uncharacterized protein n=1 Tax=Drosophila yakuba TaxID=7245 RepID=B4PP69_DROYA|nr:uncharacterized protein LOC26535415 isoform X2 [Drosophila yakuba]EDW96108.2 uncharacterized protein Dyak_GE25086 [Drosophila yakuba]